MAQSNKGSYSLSGSVVNSETGEPVRNAMVTLAKIPTPQEIGDYQETLKTAHFRLPVSPKSALSGIAGEYQFTGLAEGRYRVSAQKPGFSPMSTVEHREQGFIDLSASTDNITVRLAPLGVIEGTVVDQNGEPIDSVRIEAFISHIVDGERSIVSVHNATSDSRGAFRMWGLDPGQYYLKATGRNGGTYMFLGEGTPRPSSWLSFTPVYAGGARTLDSAAPITIAAGTQARADFRLELEPSLEIRGSLENYTPHQAVTFSLRQGGEELTAASRVNLNANTGKFEITAVTAGDYILTAVQGRTGRGEIPVHLSGSGITGLVVPLWPPVTVTGTVHNIGPAPSHHQNAAGAEDDSGGYVPDPNCRVSLSAQTGQPQHQPPGGFAPQPNGAFSIPNLFAGQYRVRFQCWGGYVTSAMSGTADLLSNPTLTIQPGATPPPIEIALKPGGGTIHGTLAVKASKGAAGVLAVPAFSSSTGPVFLPVVSGEDSSGGGKFEFFNLAPGDYALYAFSTADQIEFRSPPVLQALTGGASVHAEDGKTSEVTLKTAVK